MGNRIESLSVLSVWLGGIGLAGLMAYASYEGFRAQSTRDKDAWSAEMVGKLTGQVPLGEAERRYGQVKVVPAGQTYAELLDMQARGEMVTVRDYVGTVLPNGVETKIIGKIAQGEIIHDVILTVGSQPNSSTKGYWGAFRCDSAKGVIWESSVDRANPARMRICAIYGDYLSKVDR